MEDKILNKEEMMKGTIELEVYSDDIQESLDGLVRKITEDEIRKIVKSNAEDKIKKEIDKIIEPLVASVLSSEKFEYGNLGIYTKQKDDFKVIIRRIIVEYLNEPCYLYSKTANKMSEITMRSSGNRDSSRMEIFVKQQIIKYFDDNIVTLLKPLMEQFIEKKDEFKRVAERELSSVLKKMLLSK